MRKDILLLPLLIVVSFCSQSCEPSIIYSPPIPLPFSIMVSPSGVSIIGTRNISTPLGTVTINSTFDLVGGDDETIVIIRDANSSWGEKRYKITGGQNIEAILKHGRGTTRVNVENKQIIIDVTNSSLEEITFMIGGEEIKQPDNWANEGRKAIIDKAYYKDYFNQAAGGSVELRESHHSKSVVTLIPRGKEVRVIDYFDERHIFNGKECIWAKVSYGSHTGWLSECNLKYLDEK